MILRLQGATLGFGHHLLWEGLDIEVRRGEFIAVLGANGTGKTGLLKVILGQMPLRAGRAEFLGGTIRSAGHRRIGYIPQQQLATEGVPLRGQDLIALGVDGHHWGLPLPSRRRRQKVDELVSAVGAERYRRSALATLSGGEQQRLRVGQALAGDPVLLLCDEPLLSLDLTHQRLISELIDANRRARNLAVLFVTHDINPVLDMVDRVLYLANNQFRIGTVDEVLRSEVLSDMYGSSVDVIRTRGRIIVAGAPDASSAEHHGPTPVPEPSTPRHPMREDR